MKHAQQNTAANVASLVAGAAAGAAVSAAGMYWMGCTQRQRRKITKKAARSVEHAVNGLESMLEEYLPH